MNFETTIIWIAASRLYARKPEVVSGTEVEDAWRTTHEPSRCRVFFSGEKCSMPPTSRSPTTMSARPSRIGRTSLATSGAVVLVVGVGVDDHVGAELQRRVDARLEAGRQALVVGQAHEVVDAVRARDLDRRVGRAVVDHQPLDLVEAVELARQVGERLRQLLRLVEAGDLDDELHGRAICLDLPPQYPKAQVTVFALSRSPAPIARRVPGRGQMESATLTRRPPGLDPPGAAARAAARDLGADRLRA